MHAHNDSGLAPEAICVLRKGVISRTPLMPTIQGNNVFLPPLTEMKLESTPLTKDALFAFYKRLIDDVLPLRIVNYDIDGYYSDTGLE